jgi:hypothetical protein
MSYSCFKDFLLKSYFSTFSKKHHFALVSGERNYPFCFLREKNGQKKLAATLFEIIFFSQKQKSVFKNLTFLEKLTESSN